MFALRNEVEEEENRGLRRVLSEEEVVNLL